MPAVAPAAISPRRGVPASIARPEYVDQPAPARFTGEEVKDAETIERMRVAGRLAAQARELVGQHVVPGVTTDELEDRKSTRLNSSHTDISRMPSSA